MRPKTHWSLTVCAGMTVTELVNILVEQRTSCQNVNVTVWTLNHYYEKNHHYVFYRWLNVVHDGCSPASVLTSVWDYHILWMLKNYRPPLYVDCQHSNSWRSLHSKRSRVYVTVGCPSVCPFVCLSRRWAAAAASLLLSAGADICGRRVPAIERYLLQAPALGSNCG